MSYPERRGERSLHDSFSYNSCISACGVAWAEALKCLSSMACCIRPDLVAYNAASHATGLAHAWEQSLQSLESNSIDTEHTILGDLFGNVASERERESGGEGGREGGIGVTRDKETWHIKALVQQSQLRNN